MHFWAGIPFLRYAKRPPQDTVKSHCRIQLQLHQLCRVQTSQSPVHPWPTPLWVLAVTADLKKTVHGGWNTTEIVINE